MRLFVARGRMDTVEEALAKRKIPKWLVPALGYGLSAVSLFWVFAKFPFAQLGHHLRTMDWKWVAVAIVAELLVYFADAWRWKALLQPVDYSRTTSFRRGLARSFAAFCFRTRRKFIFRSPSRRSSFCESWTVSGSC